MKTISPKAAAPKANAKPANAKAPADATTTPTTAPSESEALAALIAAHNAESKAIIEFIRAHNRAAIEAHKTREGAKSKATAKTVKAND